MAHFAELDKDNTVLRVIVVANDICGEPPLSFPGTESRGQEFITKTLNLPGQWRQTSYSGSFRKNYAAIGDTFDAERDAFIAPKPFASWTLNESTCRWEAPVAYPTDGQSYFWNEDDQEWVAASAG
jgi:hypothetical protein